MRQAGSSTEERARNVTYPCNACAQAGQRTHLPNLLQEPGALWHFISGTVGRRLRPWSRRSLTGGLPCSSVRDGVESHPLDVLHYSWVAPPAIRR
jgi:hypothetical protein